MKKYPQKKKYSNATKNQNDRDSDSNFIFFFFASEQIWMGREGQFSASRHALTRKVGRIQRRHGTRLVNYINFL